MTDQNILLTKCGPSSVDTFVVIWKKAFKWSRNGLAPFEEGTLTVGTTHIISESRSCSKYHTNFFNVAFSSYQSISKTPNFGSRKSFNQSLWQCVYSVSSAAFSHGRRSGDVICNIGLIMKTSMRVDHCVLTAVPTFRKKAWNVEHPKE